MPAARNVKAVVVSHRHAFSFRASLPPQTGTEQIKHNKPSDRDSFFIIPRRDAQRKEKIWNCARNVLNLWRNLL